MVYSAGIFAYRYASGHLEVMLVHPGGPFWAKKDDFSWSIPKGEIENGESAEEASRREFKEETGVKIDEELVELGSIKQSSQKTITAFAICKDIDTSKVKSNTFEVEWPPKSGKMQMFPENDKAQWFSIQEARIKLFKGQIVFLEKLICLLNYVEPIESKEEKAIQLSFFDIEEEAQNGK